LYKGEEKMDKQPFNRISLVTIFIVSLLLVNCENILESFDNSFKDDDIGMEQADQNAKESITGASNSIYSGLLQSHKGSISYDSSLVISEELADIFKTITSYDTTVFTYDTVVVGTDTTFTPDSIAIDTLIDNYFVYNNTYHVTGSDTMTITTGEDTIFYTDSTFSYTDTLIASTNTYQYDKTINFSEVFTLDLVRILHANSKKDTVSLNNRYANLELIDLVSAFELMNKCIVPINDGLFTYDTTVFTYDTVVVGTDTTFIPDSIAIDTSLTSYNLRTHGDTTNSFVIIDNANSGNIVLYFTDYVRTNLYGVVDNIVEAIELKDDSMPLETMAGFFDVSGSYASPVVKSRNVYSVGNEKLLLEIITTDQTKSKTFQAAFHFE
jgi:hypothetical protein